MSPRRRLSRRARSALSSHAHHQGAVDRAETERARLRAACGWVVAAAARSDRLGEATRAVLGLAHALAYEGHPSQSVSSIETARLTFSPPTRAGASRARARVEDTKRDIYDDERKQR